MSHVRSDDGAIAGFEALAFGALIFVAGTLLIVNAWGVVDAKMAVSAAAREATRTFVEAPATLTIDEARARALDAARRTMQGHGSSRPVDVEVRMAGAVPGGGLVRCAPVTTTVTTTVPSLILPFVGVVREGGFEVRATYREVVDPFRAGLDAGGTCAH